MAAAGHRRHMGHFKADGIEPGWSCCGAVKKGSAGCCHATGAQPQAFDSHMARLAQIPKIQMQQVVNPYRDNNGSGYFIDASQCGSAYYIRMMDDLFRFSRLGKGMK